MTYIISHRALSSPFLESSLEAFEYQLQAGFALEFDLQFSADQQIVISHENDLTRLTQNQIPRQISTMILDEILELEIQGCHLCSLEELCAKISDSKIPGPCAIHFKGQLQTSEYLTIFLEKIRKYDQTKFFVFDLKPESAFLLRKELFSWQLAPSVAHPFDVKRYNSVVGETLLTIEEALAQKELFDWVWLDEWDLTAESGQKTLYNSKIFEICRQNNLKIAIVSPELHATSPHLLGGEAHPDGKNKEKVFQRAGNILKLKPDAICTDYSEEGAKWVDF